jgi:hypothetical protein
MLILVRMCRFLPVLITIVRSPSNQKLVVSAAINQVCSNQNLLDRLMRVSITYPNYSYPLRDRGPLAAISIELVVAAARRVRGALVPWEGNPMRSDRTP